jgi:hypothetical protein
MGQYLRIRFKEVPLEEGDPVERLCRAMGLVSGRDKDKTVIQVFRTVILHSGESGIGGSEVSALSGVNRITCIHHLNRLEQAGIMEKENRRYHLRRESLKRTMRELRREALVLFDLIDQMVSEIEDGQRD